jgi:hypothetical protein
MYYNKEGGNTAAESIRTAMKKSEEDKLMNMLLCDNPVYGHRCSRGVVNIIVQVVKKSLGKRSRRRFWL